MSFISACSVVLGVYWMLDPGTPIFGHWIGGIMAIVGLWQGLKHKIGGDNND